MGDCTSSLTPCHKNSIDFISGKRKCGGTITIPSQKEGNAKKSSCVLLDDSITPSSLFSHFSLDNGRECWRYPHRSYRVQDRAQFQFFQFRSAIFYPNRATLVCACHLPINPTTITHSRGACKRPIPQSLLALIDAQNFVQPRRLLHLCSTPPRYP
jgi:hypothetical protein